MMDHVVERQDPQWMCQLGRAAWGDQSLVLDGGDDDGDGEQEEEHYDLVLV